jgi:hypothetical protein
LKRRIGGAGGGSDPGTGKGAGRLVAAGAAALAIASGTTGALSLGGASVESSAAADSPTGKDLNTRKSDGKKSAQKGKSDEAWSRMGMRRLKETFKQDLKCVVASTGQVREFFLRTPCTSLDRKLFTVGDGHGNSAVISVAWIGFRNRKDADAFEKVEAVQGSGDITPLAGALLGIANVRFSGHHYQPRGQGTTKVIAETETATGYVADDVLDALAEVAVYLPRR